MVAMLPFARVGRVVAGSFRKSLGGLTPSMWSCENKVMATGSKKKSGDDESTRCDMYDKRKYSHLLPKYDTATWFEPLPNIPTGVFRNVSGEPRLGPGAAKCYHYYQNPEYFCFHHMTYYDFHLILSCCRQPSFNMKRKP